MKKHILTDQQKQKILEEWNSRKDNPPSLLELIRIAFPDDEKIDGRSKEGKAVKEFLATRKIKARAAHEYKYKEKIILTEEQKEYIQNNGAMMKGLEMAKILFKDHRLTQLNQETRAVNEYAKTLRNTPEAYEDPDENVDTEYKVPKTFISVLARVNKYVHDYPSKEKITGHQKRCLGSLIGYLGTYRFVHQISRYRNVGNRTLFESSFVRYTHDKGDLTQEEVDQYILLASEVVIASNIQRRIERLQDLLDEAVNEGERRVSMSLVEAISSAQTEYNQCVNRQNKLLGDLKEKRSEKLKKQIKENASILNLVQLWKEEESRQKLIKLADLRKKTVKQEMENLSSMDEIKCRILGLSEGEVLDE